MIDDMALIYKKKRIIDLCVYGYKHFCDGKVNQSVAPNEKPKKRCPQYHDCELRKHSIFETEKRECQTKR